LFDRGPEESAAPATALAVRDWTPYGSSGAEEEQINVGIDL
jgi:hypothetical protein